MVNKKSIIMLLLITLLTVFSFAGCGDDSNATSDVNSGTSPQKLSGELRVSFLDVGQGDSIFIELPNEETMLIDAGNPADASSITKYIQDAGYDEIDYVVATHPHGDHIGGMADIIKTFDIGSIYMPKAGNNTASFENLLDVIDEKGYEISTAKAGVNVLNDGNLNIDIIAPVESSYSDLNNYSAVIKLNYGSTSFLFMGDAEKLVENQITAEVNADVIKVGHHGSEYSSGESFIEAVSPKYAVISVGVGNQYGHPSNETLKTLNSVGSTIYRTDLDGTIAFTSDGSNISIGKSPSYGYQDDTDKAIPLPAATAPDTNQDDVIVYVTDTGSKYHRDGCQYLSKSKIPISLSEAVLSYEPCSRCNPPVLDPSSDSSAAVPMPSVVPPPDVEQQPAPSEPQEIIVYVTDTGSKYHNAGCSYLKSSNPMPLSDAKSSGYTPCSRCHPPQ